MDQPSRPHRSAKQAVETTRYGGGAGRAHCSDRGDHIYLPPPHSPQTRQPPPSRPPLRRSPPRPALLAPWPNAPAAAAGPRMHPSSAAAAEQQAPPALQGGGRGRGPGGAWRRREALNQSDIRTGLRAAPTQGSCERPRASGAGKNLCSCAVWGQRAGLQQSEEPDQLGSRGGAKVKYDSPAPPSVHRGMNRPAQTSQSVCRGPRWGVA